MSSEPDLQTLTTDARRRHLAVTMGLLALSALAYLMVVLTAAGSLPATMATHFDLRGQPDGFMSTTTALAFQGAALILIPGALVLTMAAGQWWRGTSARFISVLVAGFTVALSVLFVVLTLAHVGVTDANEVRLTGAAALLALGAGAAAGLAAGLLLPKPLPGPASLPVEPMVLGATDRASWFGSARTGQGGLLLIGSAIVLLAMTTIATAMHWLWILVAVVVLLALGVTSFNVTIDNRGLRWKAALGYPRGKLKLDSITDIDVMTVNVGDFGGFGLRSMPGRLGLITRAGSALRVRHARGELVVTVDDAVTAAAVLKGILMAQTRNMGKAQ